MKGQLHITYKPRLLNKVIHNLSNIHLPLSALTQNIGDINKALEGSPTQGGSYQLNPQTSEHTQKGLQTPAALNQHFSPKAEVACCSRPAQASP